MAVLFNLEIFTPSRLFFSGPVESIIMTLSDGDAAVLANHAPFTAPVVPCLIKICDDQGNWRTAFTAEGILEVTGEKTVLVSDAAEWPEEIDYEEAKAEIEEAEETLAGGLFRFETETASASLRRAKMRLKAIEKN